MRLFLLSLISFSFFTFGLTVTDSGEKKSKIPKYNTTVKLEISASEDIKNQIYSYISRELRSLGDVEIVENNPEWIIDIVALQVKDKNSYDRGVAFSIVIEKGYKIDVNILLSVVKDAFKINSDDWEKLKKRKNLEEIFTVIITNGGNRDLLARDLVDHSLRIDNTENINNLCKEIVADFDAEYLKKERDMWQKISNMLSKVSNK